MVPYILGGTRRRAVIIKGMKEWMPKTNRNMVGERILMKRKYGLRTSGPAYAAGASAQKTEMRSPSSGRCSLAKATNVCVVPCEWQTRPSFSNPVSYKTREV